MSGASDSEVWFYAVICATLTTPILVAIFDALFEGIDQNDDF